MPSENIFGLIDDRVFTIVIDTSWQMNDMLPFVKRHIMASLVEITSAHSCSRFNIICCNTKGVRKWSDHPVECKSSAVNAAQRWMDDIKCKKDRDIKKAITSACQDGPVYLVLNGVANEQMPDGHAFLHPVHCILLSFDKDRWPNADDVFCEDLAKLSRGSFRVCILTHSGDLRKVFTVFKYNGYPPDYKACSITTSLNRSPSPSTLTRPTAPLPAVVPVPPYYPYYWPHLCSDLIAQSAEIHKTPIASIVARGTRVLARRRDGYYYRGCIAQEVEQNQSQFLIEFDRMKKGYELRMEEVLLQDIIALYDAQRHSVVPGDKVLAQWMIEKARFGPGEVIAGAESRKGKIGDYEDSDLIVSFWNGKTEKIERGQAIWIPGPLYDRIVTELQMPRELRESKTAQHKDATRTAVLYDDLLDVPFVDLL